jgi:hypothetical protein
MTLTRVATTLFDDNGIMTEKEKYPVVGKALYAYTAEGDGVIKTKPCIWCGKHPAAVPLSRESLGKFKKEICSICHFERLKGALKAILSDHEKQMREAAGEGD